MRQGRQKPRYRCRLCRNEYGRVAGAKRWPQTSQERREKRTTLIAEHGGSCRECGYSLYEGALEFHHLNPSEKEFSLSIEEFWRPLDAMRKEAEKCRLLCRNCHGAFENGDTLPSGLRRSESAMRQTTGSGRYVTVLRQRRRAHLVELHGGQCRCCGYSTCESVLNFHHLDRAEKCFDLSGTGLTQAWVKVLAEAQKCILACAVCHTEIEAGLRDCSELRPVLV